MLPEETSFICRCCGLEKNISPEKHRFFFEKGYDSAPMFCDSCISARLDQIWEPLGERRAAICSACGCETRLSFVPCKEMPVYCSECFKKHSDTD